MEIVSEKKSIESIVGTFADNGACGNSNGTCQINVSK